MAGYFLSQVEVKPYVLDDQFCDECQGSRSAGRFAPFFCANVTCLQVHNQLIDCHWKRITIKEKTKFI